MWLLALPVLLLPGRLAGILLESTLLLFIILSLAFPPKLLPGYGPVSFLLASENNTYASYRKGLFQSNFQVKQLL